MALRHILQSWVLFTLAIISHPAFAQHNSCPSGPASHGAHCIRRQGRTFVSGYCSSVLAITTPTSTVLATSTETLTFTSTTTTGVHTVTEPPSTHLTTRILTINSTSTISETTTSITTTFTSFNATTTTTSTSIMYIYTCPSSSISVPVSSSSLRSTSIPISSSRSMIWGTALSSTASYSQPNGNLSVSVSRPTSGTGYGSYSLPPYATGLAEREAAAFSKPPCLRHYINEYGRNGVSSACECFALPTPTAATTTVTFIDRSTTVTSTTTSKVERTTSVTPTATKTTLETTTKKFSAITTITTSIATTLYATLTRTHVVTSTSFTSLPTPSSFNIFYIDSTANNTSPPANFFQAVTAPGGSGIMLAPESAADNFGINILGRLVDFTAGNKFIVNNTDDLYPFEYLVTGALNQDSPICSLCNGFVDCNYPGTTGNTFAICFGYLALGQPDVFRQDANGDGKSDCEAIALQYK